MFTHLNDKMQPRMVDISDKMPCQRMARAEASIVLHPDIVASLVDGEIYSPQKGAVFHTAILAGIQAAKQTAQIVPLCHPIPLSACDINISMQGNHAHIECKVISHYATGVEMEAIFGASVAAITIYDMCKGINSDMTIENVRLIEKVKT